MQDLLHPHLITVAGNLYHAQEEAILHHETDSNEYPGLFDVQPRLYKRQRAIPSQLGTSYKVHRCF